MQKIIITKEESGGRLDKYLLRYLNEAPKSFVYKMLRKKNIKLNDVKAQGNEILQADDEIELYLSDDTIDKFSEKKQPHKSKGSIDIIFEDENILICSKPAGLLSQPAKSSFEDSLITRINGYYSGFSALCNRLDRNTTGIVICGKNPLAVREINNAIADKSGADKSGTDKSVKKYYLALVKGQVINEGVLESFYKKNEGINKAEILENGSKGDKRVITKYRPMDTNEDYSLLEAELITGKSHQIRLHLQHAGFPIIGDMKYGDLAENRFFLENAGVKYQLLHSYKIIFNGLTELEYLNGKTFTAPMPKVFEEALKMANLKTREG